MFVSDTALLLQPSCEVKSGIIVFRSLDFTHYWWQNKVLFGDTQAKKQCVLSWEHKCSVLTGKHLVSPFKLSAVFSWGEYTHRDCDRN